MSSIEFFELPIFKDDSGDLIPIEVKDYVNWTPKRVYYLLHGKGSRGGHSHGNENELFVCIQGKVTAKLNDGEDWITKELSGPGDALKVDANIWHEFNNFSDDAILMAISSTNYTPSDYDRDFNHFLNKKKND
ncbi:FdtA/QdtA family cupin domain-containing protein [Patescibacteria group bacterium]|nr:FdtA/QdtA family cupin domain-containing protein [Patescibacteria group bacterium]